MPRHHSHQTTLKSRSERQSSLLPRAPGGSTVPTTQGDEPLEQAIQAVHTLAAARLPAHHKDPFNPMIIAQAQLENIKLVSADSAIDAYDVELVRA